MDNWAERLRTAWFASDDAVGLSTPRALWFRADAQFDQQLHAGFADCWQAARDGGWLDQVVDARSALAQLILLDQLPRNLFRGSAEAFASDAAARELALLVQAQGWDAELPPVARWFCYLPFEHSEHLADQQRSLELFTALPPDSPGYAATLDYAQHHFDIVARFGRFPHRNAALGRTSTPEELAFLAGPGSSF